MKYADMFQVRPGTTVDLSNVDPGFKNDYKESDAVKEKLQDYGKRLCDLQYKLFAEGKQSLLIVLQGMDTAGKDGTITHVVGSMNPQGLRICSFKVPTPEEASHDFLWRIEKQAPAKGEVVVFNRSHYEDVLIVRVHNLVPQAVWSKRYSYINSFEEQLAAAGTQIIKLFLHISPEEQLKRFKDRLDDPLRQWKINDADYSERQYWGDYMRAYEDALTRTSTDVAPWYVIPSNHKWFRDLAISEIIAGKLESMGMKIPPPAMDIEAIRHKYHQAHAEEKRSGG